MKAVDVSSATEMACILKFPGESKGVVVFTTIEQDRCYVPERHEEQLAALKDEWVLGVHYNGPDATIEDVFDFAISGPSFVENLKGKYNVPIDAGRLAPPCFEPKDREKHWDILYVARCTKRKNVEFFFHAIKKIFEAGHDYRVLLVATVPEKLSNRFPPEPEDVYMDVFTKEERNRFTFLPLHHDLPFPLDRETLAEFYKSSRVFVHPSRDEDGRARNVGYAWASGLPVVGLNLYPTELEKHGVKEPPYYYEAKDYNQIPERLVEAVEDHREGEPDLGHVRDLFSITNTKELMKSEIQSVFDDLGEPFVDEKFFLENLDVRIARHHGIGEPSKNVFGCSFDEFLDVLGRPEELESVVQSDDPEEDIARNLFGRDRSEETDRSDPVTLPTPASERERGLIRLSKRLSIYRPAKRLYRRSTLVQRVYSVLNELLYYLRRS